MAGHERAAARREKFLQTGLELFGTLGYTASTIEILCEHAGLVKRYFYESFTDRADLFRCVYDAQIQRLQEVMLDAVLSAGPSIEEQIRVAVPTFVRSLAQDERVARIVFLEVFMTGAAMQARWQEARMGFADFLADTVTRALGTPRSTRIEMGTLMLVGAVSDLMTYRATGSLKVDIDEIAAISIEHFEVFYHRFLSELEEPVANEDRRLR